MQLKFNASYFYKTLVFFAIEVLIATVLSRIGILRAYVGDILVILLLYCLVLSFVKVKNKDKLLIGIFIFAVVVEVLQYFRIASYLGFSYGSLGYILLGNHFSWEDIVCYAIGCGIAKLFL
jgi:hypothetical protein